MRGKRKMYGKNHLYNFYYMVYEQDHKDVKETVGFLYTFLCPWRSTKEIEEMVIAAILFKEKGII